MDGFSSATSMVIVASIAPPVADASPYVVRVDTRTGRVWVGTGNADAIYNQGIILWNQGKIAEARTTYERALAIHDRLSPEGSVDSAAAPRAS